MDTVVRALPQFWDGTMVTVQVAVGAYLLAIVISFIVGLARTSPSRLIRTVSAGYIGFFRGTSALVQLFWIFYVLPMFGINFSPMQTGILGLALCSGAYGAEIVRSGIAAVPKGQTEAASSLGLSSNRTFLHVILPQALVHMTPAFGNMAIELLKLTSLVSLLTLSDLTFVAQSINATTMKSEQIFSTVMLIYLVLGLLVGGGTRLVERRLGRHMKAAR